MGKSTAAAAFRRARIPVFDADAEVHRLQAKGGRAVTPIAAAFPAVVQNGIIDRAALRRLVMDETAALRGLEQIVHPLVRQAELAFIGRARRAGRPVIVLDIPLLFETGGERRVDFVVVVTAPRAVQIARVSQRRKMSRAETDAVIARQMPDAEKRRRADLLVRTGLSRHHALRQLRRFIGLLQR